jgi:hypothetical protein
MKRLLFLLFCLLVVNKFASAQVIADFQTDANGFINNGWGPAVTSVAKATDPSNPSNGVLAVTFNGSLGGNGSIEVDNVDGKGAHTVTYFVWLPVGIPDSINFQLWGQDNSNWSWNWNYQNYKAMDLPKGKWVPLTFYLEEYRIDTANFKFDAKNHKIGKMGIQMDRWGEHDADANWTGTIYVDNVSLMGVEPKSIATFETSDEGYSKGGWGTLVSAVAKAADPAGLSAGALKVSINATSTAFDKEAIAKYTIDVTGYTYMVYYVWLPTGTPDGLVLKPYAQDGTGSWHYASDYYEAKNIPKQTWYPIYFDMALAAAKDTTWQLPAGKVNGAGIEFNLSGVVWSGDVYMDNVSLAGTLTGKKWIVSDFEAPAGGTYGFSSQGWGPAAGTPVAMADPTGLNNTRVLSVPATFTGANGKFVISKDNIAIQSTVDKSIAKAIAFDIYLPPDYPDGSQIGAVYSGPASKGNWLEDLHYTYGADSLVKGKWNTIKFNVAHHDSLGDLADTLAATFYVQIYFGTVPNWTGTLYFDNLTLVGIPTPTGTLVSPVTTARADTTLVKSGHIVNFVRFDWIDNALGSESYNLYFSKSAITNLADPGVIRFASTVTHGLQKYAHRPYTSAVTTENLYYAITATDGITETPLRPECEVGPISIQTSPTYKVKYDANFKNTFVLDGDFTEFAPYVANQIVPETAGGDSLYDWTPSSTKLNFKVDMVIDDKYLYIAADVTDNSPVTDPTAQAWSGDAIEFYLGAYDIRPLQHWHGLNYQNANGDWRVGFLANGGIATEGGSSGAIIPGTSTSDFVVLGKLTGDGYQVEARLCLDSLTAAPHSLTVTNGMLMPFRIDCNSSLPAAIGTRIAQVGVGGTPTGGRIDQDQDWKRPQGWGQLEVINGPQGVAKEDDGLPKEFKLYTNYPNPFNPSTIIRYDLKQDVQVTLKVYNVLGQEVTTLVNERQKAGRYSTRFDGGRYASGMYIYQIQAGPFVKAVKMLLLK